MTGEAQDLILTFRPLTPDVWSALEDLFEGGGPTRRCWCMYWRIGSRYRHQTSNANKESFLEVVQAGPPPGIVAFDGDLAVGWCQINARSSLARLEKDRVFKNVDGQPVSALSCFFVRTGYRRRGVAAALTREALEVARRSGAPALEAYPLDPDVSPSASFTGFVSTFLRLGFTLISRPKPERPVLR